MTRPLTSILPFLRWLGELKNLQTVRGDAVAGISVALVLIPQSMAYAQLAGLPAYYGLYAALVAPAVAALFGSSRQLATGPTAMASMMTAAALVTVAPRGTTLYIHAALLFALCVGGYRLLFGLLRMGSLMTFLSRPVMRGFTNAAAIIIITSQLDKLFGISVARAPFHFLTVWKTVAAIFQNAHWPTMLFAILSLSLLIALHHFFPKAPNVLVVVVVATIVSWGIGFKGGVVGEIPGGLPPVGLTNLDFSLAPKLLTSAFSVAVIGLIEAVAIARTMAIKTRQQIDINQEFIGQGLANVVGSIFHGYTVSGSFSRSAVNLSSGAKTGFSSIVTSGIVLIALLLFTQLLQPLPTATLAAIVMVAVFGLIRLKPMISNLRTMPDDGMAELLTFLVTLGVAPRLEIGVLSGVGLSILLYLRGTMRPRMSLLSRHPDGALRDVNTHELGECPIISILRFEGSLCFPSASRLGEEVLKQLADKPRLRYIIFDGEGINRVDATGVEAVARVVDQLKEKDIHVLFSRLRHPVKEKLHAGLSRFDAGEVRFFSRTQFALEAIWRTGSCDSFNECECVFRMNLT